MTREGITYDRKALAAITGKTADWSELAKDAVAFASARGQGGSNRAAPSVSKAHRSRVCDPDCPVGIRLTSVEGRSLGVGPCRHRAQVVRPAPAA